MKVLRLALAQINPTVGDLAGNAKKIQDNIQKARDRGADVVVFPEMALCGYPPEDLLLKPAFIRACHETLERIVPVSNGLVAIIGFPEGGTDLYNAAAILCDGKMVGTYRKQYLLNYGVFDEDRYFSPSDANAVLVVDGVRIGISICEDIWYPGGPYEDQGIVGDAELLINISASPYHRQKEIIRERMLAVRASDSLATLIFCNLVGGQDELVFDGGSVVLDSNGKLLARGKQFAEDLVVVDILVDGVVRQRLRDTRRRKERQRRIQRAVSIEEIVVPLQVRLKPDNFQEKHLVEPLDELGEIYEALVTGTRDYIQKNGFEKVVIGLSGGIDSSLVACIAADAIGPNNVVGVSMPSRYSSDHSKSDAGDLVNSLGMQCLTIPIEPAFTAFSEMLSSVFSGRSPDLTEENLQCRIRGIILMALSNKFGWLVLTTGNKSEMSTGYATLYGDMAGGFSVIKDVSKTVVYELSRYRNARKAVIPENVFVKPPSAELRFDQKDSDSLPEYSELDPILTAYVEEDRSVAEITATGFERGKVANVAKLMDKAEYKRRQAPPGVNITARAFGKDRRLPITNQFLEEGS